ncbi:MAG TPA: DnaB-like helicase N-terminal domain-containing protein, partial [Kineosporiaceae bacterium]|nr:DnaB-like helicase N-terminal domain-containing protein [Kineosporiaceae bacterium]
GWLEPGDFRDPLSREVFGVLLAMPDRSAVIDPVTVLGELHRRGRLAGDGAAAMTLIRMVEAAPVLGAVSAYGRLVLAASIGLQGCRTTIAPRQAVGPSAWQGRQRECLHSQAIVREA